MTEPLNSSSLGAMGSLLRKLDELLRTEERAQGLIGDLRIIRTKMEELLKVDSPPHTVKYWMNEARELSYDMEICVDLFVHSSQPEALPDKLAWIFTWHKEILGFLARVKEVNERCERYNLVPNSSRTKIIASHQLQTLYEANSEGLGWPGRPTLLALPKAKLSSLATSKRRAKTFSFEARDERESRCASVHAHTFSCSVAR